MDILGMMAGTALGQIGGAIQNQQQEHLMGVQLGHQMQLNQQGFQNAKDMWDYTNYENQVKHMENAGLNVGMMYGMGGGGGTTSNAGSGGSAAGGQAAANAMGMGLQGAQMASQIAVNEAQARNLNADADVKEGKNPRGAQEVVNLELQGQSLGQGIENAKAQQGLTEIQTKLNELEYDVKYGAKEELIGTLKNAKYEGDKKIYLLENQGTITNEQAKREKERLGLQLAGMTIQNALGQSGILKNKQEIEESKSKIWKMVQDNLQGWEKLDKEQQRINLEKFKTNLQAEYPNVTNTAGKLWNDMLIELDDLLGGTNWTKKRI